MKLKLINIFFLCLVNLSMAQGDFELCWETSRLLNWGDFKGDIPESELESDKYAESGRQIKVSATIVDNQIPIFKIKSVFKMDISWSRGESSKYLEHEQIHFDLTELVARKIRFSIDSLQQLSITNEDEYRKKIKQYFVVHDTLNRRFDLETNFGNDLEKQESWKELVALRLEDLAMYQGMNCEN